MAVFITACGSSEPVPSEKLVKDTLSSIDLPKDTSFDVSGTHVSILYPRQAVKGCLLLLPGWNFDRFKWCDSTNLCEKALQKGWALVLPEMGKSVYASCYFPETRKDWLKYPTLTWLTDTLTPVIQQGFELLRPGGKNYVVGLSTGGRGVVLVMNRLPVFKAAAALSGDFDQSQMPKDNLMKGIYGSFEQFTERWKSLDNPTQQILKLKTPLYIGHGKKDLIVPFAQSEMFYQTIRKLRPEMDVVFHPDSIAGHTFTYWNSEVDAVLNFFDRYP